MLRYVPTPKKNPRTDPLVYTQSAIEVLKRAADLWRAVIAAGAPRPDWEGGPEEWIPKDRHRARVRAAAAGFSTPEVRAAERAYERAFALCIKTNMGLIYKVSAKHVRRARMKGLEQEDLIQEGVLGMQRALETFAPERGISFSTYSYFWIYQTIDRAINNSGTIRVPIRTQDLTSRGKKEGKLGDRAREAGRIISLDEPVPSKGNGPSQDQAVIGDLVANHEPSPEDSYMQTEDHTSLTKAMASLTEKEVRVIEGRYVEEKTLEDVGASMGLTRERIRQIEAAAVQKLRHFCTFSRVAFNG